MPALDWGILIVAGASLIFAGLAYLKVTHTTQRIDGYLDKLPKDLKKSFTPSIIAEVFTKTITGDQKLPDGAPVQVTDVMTGYINAFAPSIKAYVDANMPMIISSVLNPPMAPGQSPGQALANQRWGTGGLMAAKAAGKVAKKAGFGGMADKIQGAAELAQAAQQLGPALKGLKDSFGKGNGDDGSPSSATTESPAGEWGPPF